MKESNNPVRNKPMRIAAIQFAQDPQDTMKVPAILEKAGFNVEQLLHAVAETGYGLYEKEKHEKKLREYIADSRKRGIHIILYANAHMLRPQMREAHPDWTQIGKNGKMASVYTENAFACVNSPWRNDFMNSIRDALELDIDGIFLDGPLFIGEGCHCANCRKLFLEQFGHSIDDASRRELRLFKSKHIARILKDVRQVILDSGKDVALYANCLGLCENITGCDVNSVSPYLDLIGTEGGFLFYGNPNDVSIWHGSEAAKFMESKAAGRPYVIFNAGNHQPWARHMHTIPETTLLYGSTVSNGANVWYGIHGTIDEFDSPAGKAAFCFNRFLAENEKNFTKTHHCSDIALLWSTDTVNTVIEDAAASDFVQAEKNAQTGFPGPFQKEFHGISDMLFRCHKQFSIIDEVNVQKGELSDFQTLILPNTSCLDDETMKKIREFVQEGGNLIATMASGMCDPEGNRRKDMPLNELLGIKTVEEMVHYDEPGCGYNTFEGDHPFAKNCDNMVFAGFPDNVLHCTYAADSETLVSAYQPMAGRYSAFNDEKFPCVTVRKFKKGNVAYISGGIGTAYADFGILDMKWIVDSLVDRFTTSCVTVENAFPTVEVELREQDGAKLLHFVNHTGFMQRPIEKMMPCPGIKVSLNETRPVKAVKALFHPSEISFTQKDGVVRFEADVVEYELIRIEF